MVLRGIQFVVDNAGDKTAVVIDLKRHRRLWEDMYDRLLIESRRGEPRESLETVKKLLVRKWKRSNG
jgi:ribosomal protein L14